VESREERLARYHLLVREANEEIRRIRTTLGVGSPGEQLVFVCECGTRGCAEVVHVTAEEYAEVRANPAHFVVMVGHAVGEIEQIVRSNARFSVVKKATGPEP